MIRRMKRKMVKIADRLGEMVGGLFKIQTKDGTEFEISPTEGHKRKLLFEFKRQFDADASFTKLVKDNRVTLDKIKDRDTTMSDILEKQDEIIKDILHVSYPDFKPEQLSKICLKYGNELYDELTMCFGWIDKEVRDKQRAAIMKELEKLSGEAETPTQKHPSNEPAD